MGLLGVALWGAWFLPALLRNDMPPGGELAALWCIHMLPLAALLPAPVVGPETTALFTFPAALVFPFAGAVAFGWPVAETARPPDLVVAAAGFLLYAIAAPLALKRSRTVRPSVEPRALRRRPGMALARALASLRSVLAVLAPLALAYAAHFDGRLQSLLRESYGGQAGWAAVLVDLAALAVGVGAADLAFHAPLRALRGRAGPDEIALEIEDALGVRLASRGKAFAAAAAAGALALALGAYLAVRPR